MLAKVLLSTAVLLAAIRGGRTAVIWDGECSRWTEWFDVDDPFTAPGDAGDFETLTAISAKHPGAVCDRPTSIMAVTVPDASGNVINALVTGDKIQANNPVNGLICRNADQEEGKKCHDYRVRFCCPKTSTGEDGGKASECPTWTEWSDVTDPGDPEHEDSDNTECGLFSKAMEARVKGTNQSPFETGDIFKFFNGGGLTCLNSDQGERKTCKDYEVRFCCPKEGAALPPCSIDFVFVIDVSSSMPDSEFLRILQFLVEFTQCFNGTDVQVSVITYDCLPKLDISLGEFSLDDPGLTDAIRGLERRGGRTRTGLALHYVKCMTDFREHACSEVIVMTDGTESNGQGTNDYLAQAGMLRYSGIELYAIAVGYPFMVNTAALGSITGIPDRVFELNDPCAFANLIIEECCEAA